MEKTVVAKVLKAVFITQGNSHYAKGNCVPSYTYTHVFSIRTTMLICCYLVHCLHVCVLSSTIAIFLTLMPSMYSPLSCLL